MVGIMSKSDPIIILSNGDAFVVGSIVGVSVDPEHTSGKGEYATTYPARLIVERKELGSKTVVHESDENAYFERDAIIAKWKTWIAEGGGFDEALLAAYRDGSYTITRVAPEGSVL